MSYSCNQEESVINSLSLAHYDVGVMVVLGMDARVLEDPVLAPTLWGLVVRCQVWPGSWETISIALSATKHWGLLTLLTRP